MYITRAYKVFDVIMKSEEKAKAVYAENFHKTTLREGYAVLTDIEVESFNAGENLEAPFFTSWEEAKEEKDDRTL